MQREYSPADKFSRLVSIKEIHVLMHDGLEQCLPNAHSNPLTRYGQHGNVDVGGQCLVTGCDKRLDSREGVPTCSAYRTKSFVAFGDSRVR